MESRWCILHVGEQDTTWHQNFAECWGSTRTGASMASQTLCWRAQNTLVVWIMHRDLSEAVVLKAELNDVMIHNWCPDGRAWLSGSNFPGPGSQPLRFVQPKTVQEVHLPPSVVPSDQWRFADWSVSPNRSLQSRAFWVLWPGFTRRPVFRVKQDNMMFVTFRAGNVNLTNISCVLVCLI